MSTSARVASVLLLCALGTAACTDETVEPNDGGGGASTGGAPNGGAGGATGGAGGEGGATTNPSAICEDLGLTIHAWSDESPGQRRGELAADFEVPLLDGTTWQFATEYSGCESYIFLPDTLVVSDLDDTSIWEKDLDNLIEASPKNTHYFFVSRAAAADTADANLQAMQSRIDDLLAGLGAEDAEHWRTHLHVVAVRSDEIGGWVSSVLDGIGRIGFAIDTRQRIRGIGMLADVKRYSSQLFNQGYWPWKSNLAYAANEANYFNAQAATAERLESEDVTVVPFWDGDVLEQFEEIDVTLPSAEEMAGFDTLEIEVESNCPNPDELEFGNCGAWDYLAWLSLRRDDQTYVELARFITSYHRETHWVVDASPMLAWLQAGGEHHFRWDFAPEWNTQPTSTHLSLRFSNRGKTTTPREVTPLWTGGSFVTAYNMAHPAIDVPIPADAQKVTFYALVTGHGSQVSSCAEFCNHQHELTVGGMTFMKEFPEAMSNDGCVGQLEHGMVPNQGGTWWFGRGGWCPGQQVEPWIEDITDLVTPGQTATLTYRGLLNGNDPPADSTPEETANINLSSYLVIER